jgi:hypothetical protein
MKICVLLLLSAVLVPAAPAERQIDFTFGHSVAAMFGHTTYDLELLSTEPALLSKLEFPLDTTAAGIEARWDILRRERREWTVSLAAHINLSNPRAPMADSDYDDYAGYPPWMWSYTESDIAMSSLFASVSAGRRLISSGAFELFAEAGYRFQYIDQEALNYSGWQVAWNDVSLEWEVYLVAYPETALKYTIIYHLASLGFLSDTRLTGRLHLAANASLLAVIASDRDDHILRTKLSTATGAGIGYLGGVRLSYRFREPDSSPYIALSAELLGLRVSTTQTQSWYADTDGEPPAGTTYTGIPHIITSRQSRIEVSLGRHF